MNHIGNARSWRFRSSIDENSAKIAFSPKMPRDERHFDLTAKITNFAHFNIYSFDILLRITFMTI